MTFAEEHNLRDIDTLTVDQKILILKTMKKRISKTIKPQFLCHLYSWKHTTDGLGMGYNMEALFPELVQEIERTGKEADPEYDFPQMINYDGLSKFGKIFPGSELKYNQKKIELIDRVIKLLKNGKK